MSIKIVTDSTADLPADLASQWDIEIVPLYVNFTSKESGDVETLRDNVDIGPADFYKRLVRSEIIPTTSQPSVDDFLRIYKELAQEGDEIVSVHVSAKLSGTYNSAIQARERMGDPNKVTVIDSGLTSMGLGLAAVAGAKAVKRGANIADVRQETERAASQMHMFAMVDTLEYLAKGGRIGKAQAFMGSMLGIKPILTLQDGEIYPLERIRSRRKAILRLTTLVEEMSPITELCTLHNTTPEDAENLRSSLGHLVPADDIITAVLGPVVGTHAGPGSVGIVARVGN